MNIRVGRIVPRQAIIGNFAPEASPPPSLVAFEVEDDDVDATTSEDDDDGDASSSGTDAMST